MAEPRRTKQQRLTGGDEPPRLANFQVVRKPYLSATALASWTSCHTRPFIDRILQAVGIELSTSAMRRGAEAHEAVQGALAAVAPATTMTVEEALAKRAFVFAAETHLIDERRRMHGYLDILFTQDGRVHILELKNTRAPAQPDGTWGAPVWPEHGLQLHFYGLLGQAAFQAPLRLSLSYLQNGSKEMVLDEVAASRDPEKALLRLEQQSVPLPHGAPERAHVLEQVQEFQRAEKADAIPPRNHADPRVCLRCLVRAWCPERLDQPGRFLELDASLLTPDD